MDVENTIRDFLQGKMDIVSFRKIYDRDPSIERFLQSIIDDLRSSGRPLKTYSQRIGDRVYETTGEVDYLLSPETSPGLLYGNHIYDSVHTFLTYERRMCTHDVETAAGASDFYSGVYSIYYQLDQSIPLTYEYQRAYCFALDVIPEYLSGGEAEKYIQKNIIPLFPETMKKTERVKAIKAKIRETFKSEKGYPCWAQSADWPLGKDGLPATYIGKGKSEGDLRRWRFRDESTGEIIVVEQYL
jgi:hypothetical protein